MTSSLLEEVLQVRRATICEEEAPKAAGNAENIGTVNETTIEREEKELVMAFNLLTLI